MGVKEFQKEGLKQIQVEHEKSDVFAWEKLIVSFEEDVPERLRGNALYIIGAKNYYWAIILLCPCGCGEAIHLNLLKRAYPMWKYKIRGEEISVIPSIWRTAGCKSHFFIRKGRIVWAKDL